MKKFKRKKLVLLGLIAAGVCVAGVFIVREFFSPSAIIKKEKKALPSPTISYLMPATKTAEAKNVTQAAQQATQTPISDKLNRDVPFTAQAPTANWDRTHEEACEEAAMLMAGRYFRGEKIAGADDAEGGIQEIIAWENENLGFFESTTVEETVKVIKGVYGLKTEIIENPNIDQIKQAIAGNKLVIVPTAGRQIGNPFYKAPGPLYHMLLIKGYTKTQFITNDAGTKRGGNYPYDFKTVLNANHDWNGSDVANGAKRMIIVFK